MTDIDRDSVPPAPAQSVAPGNEDYGGGGSALAPARSGEDNGEAGGRLWAAAANLVESERAEEERRRAEEERKKRADEERRRRNREALRRRLREEEADQAAAISGALVGECVLDSPSQYGLRPTVAVIPPRAPSLMGNDDERGVSHGAFTRERMERAMRAMDIANEEVEAAERRGMAPWSFSERDAQVEERGRGYSGEYWDDDEEGPGIISAAAGAAKDWWNRRKESRRQAELARQVEEQRQKLQLEAKKRELTKMRMNQDSSWEIDKGSSALEQKLQAVRGATKIERRVAAESAWGGVAGVAGICSAGSDSGGEVGSADDDEYYEGEGEDDHGKPHIKVSSPHSTPSGDGLAVDVDVPDDGDDTEEFVRIVIDPEPKTRDGDSPVPFLLKESHMRQIALRVLPPAIMLNRWARLYSLLRDGDSFDAFLRLTKDTQRSLLVVRTANGDIFGAYSDSPFEVKSQSLAAQFYGSAQACLWTLDTEGSGEKVGGDGEGTIKAYKWTGANRYIQLVDIRHKMIAFGGGGNAGEFGLCVEDDFQRGTTGPCGTFGNDPLCDQPTFEIVDLECWGFLSGFG